MFKLLSTVVLLTSLSACSWLTPYKIDINQGNIIEPQKVSQLKPGMSREQVRFLMGTAMLQDGFSPDRWDYLYYHKPGRDDPEKRQLSLYFQQDRLVKVTGDGATEIPGFQSQQQTSQLN